MTLTLLGVWLAALGAGDLGRAGAATVGRRRRLACLAVGGAVLLGGLLLVRPSVGWLVVLLVLLAPTLVVWLLASSAATHTPHGVRRRGAARSLAFGALAGGGLVAILGAHVVDRPVRWPTWADGTFPARYPAAAALVAVGVLLSQLCTANLVVRLVLDAVGVPATTNEKQLKGGRVLGPMERVFIVALGALGELTAVAIVIAAKGLLRFPELQRAQQNPSGRPGGRPADGSGDGPSDVTEYFLIGSFASWLIALGGAALVHLA